MKTDRPGVIGYAIGFTVLLAAASAAAQMDAAISDAELQDPWIRSKAVVSTLADAIGDKGDQAKRAQLDRDLDGLEGSLSELQAQLEKVAIRIVSKPEYSYIAAEDSRELARQIGKVEAGFAALYAGLALSDRADVLAAQAAIAALRELLSREHPFERDVTQAIGSGSKNVIQALAGRWWAASERAGEAKDAVIGLRRQPA